MLLHFALVLHFAAIIITFYVRITFCGDYYILRRNIGTLTKILLNRTLNKSNWPESNEKEREEGKEERERERKKN